MFLFTVIKPYIQSHRRKCLGILTQMRNHLEFHIFCFHYNFKVPDLMPPVAEQVIEYLYAYH